MPTRLFCLLPAILLLGLSSHVFAQDRPLDLEPTPWAIELAKGGLSEPNTMGRLIMLLAATDTSRAFPFLDSLEAAGRSKGDFFECHFCMIKARYIFDKLAGYDKYKDRYSKALQPIKQQMMQLYSRALQAAYKTEDNLTIGWVCFYSATIMRQLGETSKAVMYSTKGVEIFEATGYDVEPSVYTVLAELLYDIREYTESFTNSSKAIQAWVGFSDTMFYQKGYQYRIRTHNIAALNYSQAALPDSAIWHFDRALEIATENNDTTWTGRIMGNKGRLLFAKKQYESARTLFDAEYKYSLEAGRQDYAADAAEWIARTLLAQGQAAAALPRAREALQLLRAWPHRPYLRDTYQSLSNTFKALQRFDSAFYYYDRYQQLHDSLEREVATSSLAISKARMSDEANRFNIQKLNREKRNELLWRNIIIGSIIVLAIVALLLVNRQLLKEKIKNEQAEREKALMTQQVQAASDQLQMFTTSLIEKSHLLEQLQTQAHDRNQQHEHHATLSTLSQLTILTEQDWQEFKRLFEKAYPGFFHALTTRFPEITLAEQRMAALIRLRLSGHQMAAMLGISADSVRKSRQRLRQRFQLPPDANLDELVASLS